MTVDLVACGAVLWKRRNETGDHSRTIQAVFSWISAFFAFIFIFRTLNGTTPVDGSYLEPEHMFMPILIQMAMLLYPLELIRPSNPAKVYTVLFAPLLIVVIAGLFGGIGYTYIDSLSDLWHNIGKPDVWFRMLALLLVFLNGFALLLFLHRSAISGVDRRYLTNYAIAYMLLAFLHIAIQITHLYVLVLVHQIIWISVFCMTAWYELRIRIVVPSGNDRASEPAEADTLWDNIIAVIETEHGWRDPDLTLTSLTSKVGSNRTYVSNSFKRNAGVGFSEYISRRRVGYVVETLDNDPEADVQSLFFYVGYRSYSTAWDNFRRVTGMTVGEYVGKLKCCINGYNTLFC